jgi:hypothetical protein
MQYELRCPWCRTASYFASDDEDDEENEYDQVDE